MSDADYPSAHAVGDVVAIIAGTMQGAFPAVRFIIEEMDDAGRREALSVFGQLSASAISRIAADEGRAGDELLREIAAGLATKYPIT